MTNLDLLRSIQDAINQSPVNGWIDTPGGAARADGGRISEFCIKGWYEYWFYPPGWRPRGNIEPLGPFRNREEAKVGAQSWLGVLV